MIHEAGHPLGRVYRRSFAKWKINAIESHTTAEAMDDILPAPASVAIASRMRKKRDCKSKSAGKKYGTKGDGNPPGLQNHA